MREEAARATLRYAAQPSPRNQRAFEQAMYGVHSQPTSRSVRNPRLIGAGGMGEVYRARDTRLERIVNRGGRLRATFSARPAEQLFVGASFFTGEAATRSFDVAPDGRFLMVELPPSNGFSSSKTRIVVVENWIEEVKRRLP